jgi:type I restriction enzyme S subunit
MEKLKNIPSLRFPEFKGEWEFKRIGEITIVSAGATPSTTKKEYWGGKIRWMNSGELNLKKVYEVDNRITELGLKKSSTKLIPKHSILIGLAGQGKTRGTVAMNMIELCTNQSIGSILPNENYISEFFYHNLDNRYEELRSLSTGDGGRGGLNLQIIKTLPITLPNLQEQTKIASFLTAVDDKLQALKQKKTLLEQYKKGVMQKIFSQELRFKDDNGNEYPDWEEKKLGDVVKITMGQSPNSSSYNSDGYGIPLIQGNADIKNRVSNPRNWTTEKTKECKIGDLLLTVRAPVGAVAKSIHNACIGRGVCSIINNSKSNIEFIYQFLLDFETKWGSLEQGSTFTAVSGIEINKLEIILPSVSEQTKIANFLSVIDDKINHCQELIVNTQVWKKGLLQQMFV